MSQNENQNYDSLINECDQLIKAGKISSVTSRILRLNLAQVPRASRQGLAKICRRIDLIGAGLRLLQPVIKNEKQNFEPPTDGEICEYSVLLSRNGSIREALELLEKVDGAETPESFLYSAYCHISNWDYAKAIPLLEQFLKSSADDYSKLVARVNLVPAYLATLQLDSSEKILEETITLAKGAGASRLLGNCFELEGRHYLYRGDFPKSRVALNRASDIFGSIEIYDNLFIHKWQAVMKSLETRQTEPLIEFRQKALAQKDWESVREADLFTAKVAMDQRLLDHLIFGTPMSTYRERILHETGGTPSHTYLIGNESTRCFDLKNGHIESVEDFNAGKKIHQVIAALLKDFYVPRKIGSLFSDLYPEDYFDINSSPRRVRTLIGRSRQWLKANNLGAEITQHKGLFRFEIRDGFSVRMTLENAPIDSLSMYIEELKSKIPAGRPFTAQEACNVLHWPRSSFLRIIEAALKRGAVTKFGVGRSTRYEVASISKALKAA